MRASSNFFAPMKHITVHRIINLASSILYAHRSFVHYLIIIWGRRCMRSDHTFTYKYNVAAKMKLSSRIIIQIFLVVIAAITTVEGKHRKKDTSSKTGKPTPSPTTPNPTPTPGAPTTSDPTPAPTKTGSSSSAKSPKTAKSSRRNKSSSKSSKAVHFDICSVANPAYEQATLFPGPSNLSMDEFLTKNLNGNGGDRYLAWHSTAVYTKYADWVKAWQKDPSGKLEEPILHFFHSISTHHVLPFCFTHIFLLFPPCM